MVSISRTIISYILVDLTLLSSGVATNLKEFIKIGKAENFWTDFKYLVMDLLV